MNTTPAPLPPAAAASRPTLRPFHTPVRGHRFASLPPGGAPLGRTVLTLRVEPDNPADVHAVAVWADGGGTPWRVGYLERAVAVRVAPRLADGTAPVRASFAGWLEEPQGRWQRPLVRVLEDAADITSPRPATGLRALPPFRERRTVTAA